MHHTITSIKFFGMQIVKKCKYLLFDIYFLSPYKFTFCDLVELDKTSSILNSFRHLIFDKMMIRLDTLTCIVVSNKVLTSFSQQVIWIFSNFFFIISVGEALIEPENKNLLERNLDKIVTPTLVVWGKNDNVSIWIMYWKKKLFFV